MVNNVLREVTHYILKVFILVIAILVIYRAAIWAYDSGYDLMAKEPDENIKVVTVDITIPEGASTETIANILYENGLIGSVLYFRGLAMFEGLDSSFQKGEFVLSTGMSVDEIIQLLTTEGEVRETVTFTIPEGFTLDQIADRLAAEGICTKSDFMSVVENPSVFGYKFLEGLPDRENALQGYLFPDTYEVYADASASDVVSTMLKRFDEIYTDEYYEKAEEMGYTTDEIITIASIIEREVRVADERSVVAGVIYNRLEIEMPLQMCSTVMYVLDKSRDRLLYSDLEIKSPYNTYINAGLPVGPIANPGQASIEAALYPDNNNYLYFVLKDTESGEHEFNTTLSEHNAAKAKYNQDI